MRVSTLHDWEFEYQRARALQEELAGRVVLRPLPQDIRLVAGADIAFSRNLTRFFAAVVVLRLPELDVVEVATADTPPAAPYVPGMLTFREGPALVEAFRKLRRRPDAFIFDGQGYAHPRRLGLASHMGLWLGRPSIGCAKSRLIGEHAEPGPRRGDSAPLTDEGEQIGIVLRTRDNVKPVFVSPGHMADFETSAELVLRCCSRYRLPEPTRLAHVEVGKRKRAASSG